MIELLNHIYCGELHLKAGVLQKYTEDFILLKIAFYWIRELFAVVEVALLDDINRVCVCMNFPTFNVYKIYWENVQVFYYEYFALPYYLIF